MNKTQNNICNRLKIIRKRFNSSLLNYCQERKERKENVKRDLVVVL